MVVTIKEGNTEIWAYGKNQKNSLYSSQINKTLHQKIIKALELALEQANGQLTLALGNHKIEVKCKICSNKEIKPQLNMTEVVNLMQESTPLWEDK